MAVWRPYYKYDSQSFFFIKKPNKVLLGIIINVFKNYRRGKLIDDKFKKKFIHWSKKRKRCNGHLIDLRSF